MEHEDVSSELAHVLLTEQQIHDRLREIAADIDRDYEGKDLLLVGVLKGAVMVMADLARSLTRSADMDWMAVSSGSSRISTPTSTAGTCSSSRTSSTPASRSRG